MVVKTLQVFYGADLLPYKDQERKIHFPIIGPAFQGSSQANEIKFYIDDIGGSSLQWVACAKLPNGKIGFKILDTISDDYGTYALLTLDKWFTQVKGDLYISLKGYDGGVQLEYDSETELYSIDGEEVIQSTGSIKMTIQYATPIVEGEDFGDITIQELLAIVSTKVGKSENVYLKVVSSISDINTSTYEGYLNNGDIIYDKQQKNIYVLSGTYPTLSTTLILSFGQIVLTTGDQSIFGNKTHIGDLYVNDLGGSFWVGTPKDTDEPVYTEIRRNSVYMRHDVHGVSLDLHYYDGYYMFSMEDNGSEYYLTLPFSNGTIATQEYVAIAIETATFSVYKPQGSANTTTLNGLTKSSSMNGYVYNMSNSGILTNYDGTTESVQIGDNVVFIWNDGNWYWDDVVGIVDLSGYVAKTTTIAGVQIGSGISSQDLTDALIYATTSDITGIMED